MIVYAIKAENTHSAVRLKSVNDIYRKGLDRSIKHDIKNELLELKEVNKEKQSRVVYIDPNEIKIPKFSRKIDVMEVINNIEKNKNISKKFNDYSSTKVIKSIREDVKLEYSSKLICLNIYKFYFYSLIK